MGYESGCGGEGVEYIPIHTTHYPTHYSLPTPTLNPSGHLNSHSETLMF